MNIPFTIFCDGKKHEGQRGEEFQYVIVQTGERMAVRPHGRDSKGGSVTTQLVNNRPIWSNVSEDRFERLVEEKQVHNVDILQCSCGKNARVPLEFIPEIVLKFYKNGVSDVSMTLFDRAHLLLLQAGQSQK